MDPQVVGRDLESSALTALLDGAIAGRASALLVSGEAGIGKTALVRQAGTAPVRLRWASCLPLSSLASPLIPLRALGPELGDDPLAEMDAWLDRSAAEEPTVLVVDDVQWADASTLDVLHYVIAGRADRRFGLVVTLRTGDAEEHGLRRWLADVRRLPRVTEVRLGRLDRAATRDQLAALLGTPPTESLVDAVQARARGNPYLTSLLVRGLPPDARELPDGLPDELRDALARAWHGLPGAARRLTSELAVAGRPQGDYGPADVPSLRVAVEAGVLRVGDSGRYWFAHPLLAEVLVGELLPEERRALHAATADRLTPADGTPAGMTAGEIVNLADHHYRAGQATPAFVWARHGAEAAGDSAEAVQLLRRALELLPSVATAGTSRADLLARIRSAAAAIGLAYEELAAVDELLAELDPATAPLIVSDLLVSRAELREGAGLEYSPTATLAEAVRISAVQPSSPEHAYATARLASLLAWRRDPDAPRMAAEALKLARRCGSDRALVAALLADLEARPPAYDGSTTRQALEAQPIAARTGSFDIFVDLTFCAANNAYDRSLREHAAIFRRAHEQLAALGAPHGPISFMIACEAYDMCEAGDWRRAESLLRVAVGIRPGHLAEMSIRLTVALLASRQGRHADAAAHLARADALIADDSTFPLMTFDSVRTELAVARGDLEAALACAGDILAAYGEPTGPQNIEAVVPLAVRALASLAEAARDRGEDPAPVLARLDTFRREHPDVITDFESVGNDDGDGWYDAAVRVFRALIVAEESRAGRRADEPARWHEAIEACTTAGRAWDEAYCRWRETQAWARNRSARSRTSSALRTAHAQAVALGAQPQIDSLEALARTARIPLAEVAPPHEGGGPRMPGLTAREREILTHVIAGRSYAEIARALFLSERTVGVHVSNMLHKTGTANRVELAQLVHRVEGRPGR